MKVYKHIFTFFLLLSVAQTTLAQKNRLEPVKWSVDVTENGKNEYELIFDAVIEDGWYLYSQDVNDAGPVPTSFNFNENAGIIMKNDVAENGELIESFDKLFDASIRKYAKEVQFTTNVLTVKPEVMLTGYINFMACDAERCLPPKKISFEFNLIQNP